MTDIREKLIELLEDDDCPLLYVLGENVGNLADYLIANGVTVGDRAPSFLICPQKNDENLLKKLGEPAIFCTDAVPAVIPITHTKWISVAERLPEPFVRVLVFRDGQMVIDYHEEDGWFAFDFKGKRATHWIPLPEPPKEE